MDKVSRYVASHIGTILVLQYLFSRSVAPYRQRVMTLSARESKLRPGSAARSVKYIVQLNVRCPWRHQKVLELLSSRV